ERSRVQKRSRHMFRHIARIGLAAAIVSGATLAALPEQAGGQRQQPQQAAPSSGGPKKHLALVGGMLIAGYEVPPVQHAANVLDDNKIVDAGPASEVKIPADATIIDTS